MEEIFALIVSMTLIAAVIPLFLWKRRVDARSREEDAQPPQVTSQFFFLSLLRNGLLRNSSVLGLPKGSGT